MEKNYPTFNSRVIAAVIDSIIFLSFVFSITYILTNLNIVPDIDIAKTLAFIIIFVLYDPIFTSVFGGTIGHLIIGIRVKREKNQQKNILFPLAIIRFIVKVFLGWLSVLTVSSNNKRKAIHDLIVGSIVVYKK